MLLFASTTLLQFSSTALLSDLRLGRLPSFEVNRTSTYDFAYEGQGSRFPVSGGYFDYTRGVTYPIRWRSSTWTRNPPAFPAFAEYSEPIPVADNVDDTGILLRAFLPFADAQSRETVRSYTGTAMVLDARVRTGGGGEALRSLTYVSRSHARAQTFSTSVCALLTPTTPLEVSMGICVVLSPRRIQMYHDCGRTKP